MRHQLRNVKWSRFSLLQTKQDEEQQNEMPVQAVNASTTNNLSSASDDYFQTVVIFKTQGLRCVTFLPQVGPEFAFDLTI
jgi:hypothetical protein